MTMMMMMMMMTLVDDDDDDNLNGDNGDYNTSFRYMQYVLNDGDNDELFMTTKVDM